MRKLILIVVLTILPLAVISAAEVSDTIVSAHELKLERNTGHFVSVSGGVSHIISHVDAFSTSGEPRIGGNIQLGYEWISKKKVGIGFMYDAYITNFSSRVPGSHHKSSELKENMSLHYFAPQFVGRGILRSEKWALRYSIGMGLFMSCERVALDGKSIGSNYDYGLGCNFSFGAVYQLTPNLGLTGGVSLIQAIVKQEYMGSNLNLDGETSGLTRVNLDLGLIYHF